MELITFLRLSEKLDRRANDTRTAILGIAQGVAMDAYRTNTLENAQDFLQYAAEYSNDLEGAKELADKIGDHLYARDTEEPYCETCGAMIPAACLRNHAQAPKLGFAKK